VTVRSVATMLALWSSSPPAHTNTSALMASWRTACAAFGHDGHVLVRDMVHRVGIDVDQVLPLAAGGRLASVLDGCTNQLAEVFGNDAGIPARVAVGMAELPLGAAVETEMTVALRTDADPSASWPSGNTADGA
jgi:enamine deaminase RidA (YjgF/YER057c/UK114 family)